MLSSGFFVPPLHAQSAVIANTERRMQANAFFIFAPSPLFQWNVFDFYAPILHCFPGKCKSFLASRGVLADSPPGFWMGENTKRLGEIAGYRMSRRALHPHNQGRFCGARFASNSPRIGLCSAPARQDIPPKGVAFGSYMLPRRALRVFPRFKEGRRIRGASREGRKDTRGGRGA